MSRKRSAMKPITDLWWCYCRTNRENLCTFFWYRNLPFSGKRMSVNLCAHSRNFGKGTLYFTIAQFEQMSIWFDFCELKFNTISTVRAY
jgi:hypothetical protein